ncbi:MAG: DUF177 domain-containing protein [Methylobacteriaceae bacterium]|nr:DUF177 domain-containing protein [Methylobacteriaceae bacterium]
MSGRTDADAPQIFSRPLSVEDVPPEGLDLTISATGPERDALAAQDGLEGLSKLEGSLHVAPWRKDGVAVTGEMRARVTQICVVSLDPFESELVEPIDVKFAPVDMPIAPRPAVPRGTATRTRRAPEPADIPAPKAEFEDEDPPDPIVGGAIDLGALVAEFLALGLDPYPRKPGVAFEEPQLSAKDDIAEGPFSQLKALKGILPS